MKLYGHEWSDGKNAHIINQDGTTIFHRRCLRCGRDFGQGFDGHYQWQAAYLGLSRIEPLPPAVTEKWMSEECPGDILESDADDRASRSRIQRIASKNVTE